MKLKRDKNDSLRSEYDLNNLLKDRFQDKYAQLYKKGTNLVLLEPDVAKAFKNEKVVVVPANRPNCGLLLWSYVLGSDQTL